MEILALIALVAAILKVFGITNARNSVENDDSIGIDEDIIDEAAEDFYNNLDQRWEETRQRNEDSERRTDNRDNN